jgi:hypothetical protein
MYKHKLYQKDKIEEMLKFLNNNNQLKVISITQAKNNDFNLFYFEN